MGGEAGRPGRVRTHLVRSLGDVRLCTKERGTSVKRICIDKEHNQTSEISREHPKKGEGTGRGKECTP